MPATIWQRHSAPLIELSLTGEAPADERRWELRLEGSILELKLFNDAESFHTLIAIERNGTEIAAIKVNDIHWENT